VTVVTLPVEMRMQGRNDCYCGLYCLSTEARLFGLSGRLRPEWRDTADKKPGIGRLKLVEIAQEMGIVATRGRWWRIRDITDVQPNSVWLARIWCSLPDANAESGWWTGAHYVLVLGVRRSLVTLADPYPQAGLEAVRDVPRSKFGQEWRCEQNWAVELRSP
jgi:hypothetical protein